MDGIDYIKQCKALMSWIVQSEQFDVEGLIEIETMARLDKTNSNVFGEEVGACLDIVKEAQSVVRQMRAKVEKINHG